MRRLDSDCLAIDTNDIAASEGDGFASIQALLNVNFFDFKGLFDFQLVSPPLVAPWTTIP
jgi:hypothetical protein